MTPDAKTAAWAGFSKAVRDLCDTTPTTLTAHDLAVILRLVAEDYDVEG